MGVSGVGPAGQKPPGGPQNNKGGGPAPDPTLQSLTTADVVVDIPPEEGEKDKVGYPWRLLVLIIMIDKGDDDED